MEIAVERYSYTVNNRQTAQIVATAIPPGRKPPCERLAVEVSATFPRLHAPVYIEIARITV